MAFVARITCDTVRGLRPCRSELRFSWIADTMQNGSCSEQDDANGPMAPEQRSMRRTAITSIGSTYLAATAFSVCLAIPPAAPKTRVAGIRVGKVVAEIRTVFAIADGLPSDDVSCVAVSGVGEVIAGTSHGLAQFNGQQWTAIEAVAGPVKLLAPVADGVFAAAGDRLWSVRGGNAQSIALLPTMTHAGDDLCCLAADGAADRKAVWLGTRFGLFKLGKTDFTAVGSLNALLGAGKAVRQVAIAADGRVAVAGATGLFVRGTTGTWDRPNPVDGVRSWWLRDVRGVAFDSNDKLWFASPAGAGRQIDAEKWSLYTGDEGLPYNDRGRSRRNCVVRHAQRGESFRRFDLELSTGSPLAARRRCAGDCRHSGGRRLVCNSARHGPRRTSRDESGGKGCVL